MTFTRLLLRNLLYHWRGNLAVFLGVVLGSAVLTGALLVGDSLRGSLQELTLSRLGWVDQAVAPGRFFEASLADRLDAGQRAPLLSLQGSASLKSAGVEKPRVGKVNVLGVDASFWQKEQLPESGDFWSSDAREVLLNESLARVLAAKTGDKIVLRVQAGSSVPGESLLGHRQASKAIEPIEVTVRGILPDAGMARFSMRPTPEPVRNAFVPIRLLQKTLKLEGRANVVLIAGVKPGTPSSLCTGLTLADWSLRYRSPKDRAEAFFNLLSGHSERSEIPKSRWHDTSGPTPVNRIPDALARAAESNKGKLSKAQVSAYYEEFRRYHVLESERMLLEAHVVQAIEKLATTAQDKPPRWRLSPTLIYLADTISDGRREVPYSIIAGQDSTRLKDDQIILTHWRDSPLIAKSGSRLTLKYFVPDEKNHLMPRSEDFKLLLDPLPIEGVLDDPDYAPEVPGVTDKLDITNWESPPFPYDPNRNSQADKDFSKRYRTTPRAYVTLKKAQQLWGNRFGNLTSIRIEGASELPERLPDELLQKLDPAAGGFVLQNLRDQAIHASAGATPFGVLFLSFSIFLIVSALLLVGLLSRLNIDRRASEMGLLLATGWSPSRVRNLLLGEGVLLAVLGGLAGLAGALIYASLMLQLLSASWPGGAGLPFLRLHVEPLSFVIGYFSSLVVSVLTLLWASRMLVKLTPRALLAGETAPTVGPADGRPAWSRWLIPAGVLGALALAITARFLPAQEAKAGSFFGSGALLLTACLSGVWYGLKSSSRASAPQPSLTRLGMRNAARHAVRSLLTVGLLSAASFLIVAVESFHKQTDQHFLHRTGGSGGLAFYAEGSVPVFEDLNQPKVRAALPFRLDTPEMQKVVLYPCRVQPGDDASCLNLYKPLKPRVMGVAAEFIQRGGFHFGKTEASSDEEKANPWLLLDRPKDDAIPALIDANTAQWILKLKVGDIVAFNKRTGEVVASHESPQDAKLRIVGLLEESIFQSEILIAESAFLKLYPTHTGFSFFLVDAQTTDAEKLKEIGTQLHKGLEPFNLDVATTASRLEGYLAVENMYLLTFQALGGLGLVLGAVGLSIVLLRGVWERRAELALLQALGFGAAKIAWLVLAENLFLLVLGLAAGALSALVAVAPHLIGAGAQVLWLRIALLLVLVLAVGLSSAVLSVWTTLRTPVLTALRRE